MATGFGRKGTLDDDMAARRAAFLASERARAAALPEEPARPASRYGVRRTADAARGKAQALVEEKTVFAAYINWFLFGCVGAHRFYLGYMTSGAGQATLSVGGLMLLFSAMTQQSIGMGGFGIFMIAICGLWLLGDLVLIPSMCERANTRLRRGETGRKLALD